MSAWVECFVSVRFDLDVGPVVEHVTPKGAITKEGERLVAQAAFPDCNPDCGHEFVFFFTIPDAILRVKSADEEDVTSEGLSSSSRAGMSDLDAVRDVGPSISNGSFPSSSFGCAPTGGGLSSSTTRGGGNIFGVGNNSTTEPRQLLLGAAHYRQKRDAGVPRGYVQQVILLLSRVPYLIVHELIMRVVVPRCNQCCRLSPDTARTRVASVLGPSPSSMFAFDGSFHPAHLSQSQVLDMAIQELATWPSPHPHVQYSTSLLNQSLSFITPPRDIRPTRSLREPRKRKILLDDRVRIFDARQQPCFTQNLIPLYHILGDHLESLTALWELLISHQSILILSNTPSMCSAAAIAVTSLIMPIRFVGDLRTYFTVQDGDFSLLSKLGKPGHPFPAHYSVVVSGTNPFFVRAFAGWKHLMSVCDPFSNRAVHGRGLSTGGSADTEGDLEQQSTPVSMERLNSTTMSGFDVTTPTTPNTSASPSATSGTGKGLLPASTSTSSGWQSLQWGFHNHFQTNFSGSFVLDHKDLTESLQQRISQCLRLPEELQRISMLSSPENLIQPLTVSDDIVRKFFTTLTQEFLVPIRMWFDNVAAHECEPFQLCCVGVLDTMLFHPGRFLSYLRDHRKQIVPPLFRGKASYRHYKILYERFCQGVLFRSFVEQLQEQKISSELAAFREDEWASNTPMEKRVDMFINLHSVALREWQSYDPDLVLLASATAVLSEMAMRVPAPLQSSFMQKVELLKFT